MKLRMITVCVLDDNVTVRSNRFKSSMPGFSIPIISVRRATYYLTRDSDLSITFQDRPINESYQRFNVKFNFETNYSQLLTSHLSPSTYIDLQTHDHTNNIATILHHFRYLPRTHRFSEVKTTKVDEFLSVRSL